MTQSPAALSITDEPVPAGSGPRRLPDARTWRVISLVGVGVAAWVVVLLIDGMRGFVLHAPRWQLLGVLPLVLQVHIAAAVTALGVGFALMVGVKGRRFHKVAGWIWVASMTTVAISSFWIRDHGQFSYIHLLSGWVSISVPMAVAAVKRRNVKRHRTLMTNLFMGGLVVAGAFTLVPGRLMWRVFLG